jgi:hypothetical protein
MHALIATRSAPGAIATLLLVVAPVHLGLAFQGKIGVSRPPNYSGGCPTTLVFVAQFSSLVDEEVDFVWIRSDGVEIPASVALEPAPGGRGYMGSSTLEWEVSTSTRGEIYAAVRPESYTLVERSRGVTVLCDAGSASKDDRTNGEEDTSTPVQADARAWQLGAATVFVVGGNSGAAPASSTESAQTQTFSCPAQVELAGLTLQSGWERGSNRVVVPFAAAAARDGNLICVYEANSRPPTVPVSMRQPTNTECTVSGRQFTCTAAR